MGRIAAHVHTPQTHVCVLCMWGFTIFTGSAGGACMPHWRPRVGSLPIGEVHGAGQGCVPVLPLDQCDMHFRPEPGSRPHDHPGSGVVAPWLLPGQLRGISSTSPLACVCCARVCWHWLVGASRARANMCPTVACTCVREDQIGCTGP